MILELSGTILGAFGGDFRDLFLSLLRVLWKPASSSVLVVLGTFFGGPRELCGAPQELFVSSGE